METRITVGSTQALELMDKSRAVRVSRAPVSEVVSSKFVVRLAMPTSAAEDLLEVVMRRYERASTIVTSNRPLEDWPKLFGDTPAVTAFLDRLMHHGHLIEMQ